MTEPQAKAYLADLKAYVGGKAKVKGVADPIKLSSNESPLGPSPKAMEAFTHKVGQLAAYPDGGSSALREAIADTYGLDPARIICGNGSDEILLLLGSAYLQPGDEAIYSEHGFVLYKLIIKANGATPVAAPETDVTANVDAILKCVTDKTRIVYLANPNNPTGTYLPAGELERLHAGLPAHVVLVLDGAYAEYVTETDYEAGAALVERTKNVVMTRTFSKIYGLAALRVGWGYCPPAIADVLNRLRAPFNVNAVAHAAATAAVRDQAFTKEAVAHNTYWRDWLTKEIRDLGLTVPNSVGNFILILFQDAQTADAADTLLQQRGLILRRMDGYGFAEGLRLSVGLEDANRAVVAVLNEFVNTS